MENGFQDFLKLNYFHLFPNFNVINLKIKGNSETVSSLIPAEMIHLSTLLLNL